MPLSIEQVSIPAPRVIKICGLGSATGTMVTVHLKHFALGSFIPNLVFNGLMLKTKCLQSDDTTNLTAMVPPHQPPPFSSVFPLYFCLCDNEGIVMAWHLTDFLPDHSQKLLDSTLGHSLEHSPLFYQCSPAAIYGESKFLENGSKRLNFPPLSSGSDGYPSRLLSTNDAPSFTNEVPLHNAGFTTFLTAHLGDPAELLQQRRRMPSAVPPCPMLYMHGDLNTMTEDWTPAEHHTQRRIVEFNRTKVSDQQTHCAFQPTARPEAVDGEVVSCIYWPENNNWYFTSVECLKLLEYLMDRRFSVDEKNRVRRNLEGFCPLTLTKTKPGSADFFKRIMAYPPPKPRNIEKDLKVFPWKVLALAVKKISTKYGFKRADPSHLP